MPRFKYVEMYKASGTNKCLAGLFAFFSRGRVGSLLPTPFPAGPLAGPPAKFSKAGFHFKVQSLSAFLAEVFQNLAHQADLPRAVASVPFGEARCWAPDRLSQALDFGDQVPDFED
jgi:hypothetical protein